MKFSSLLRLILLGISLCFVGAHLHGAVDPWDREAITTWQDGSGLPGLNVQAITQTDDGYLWIATNGGLARFDGKEFHPLPPSQQPQHVSEIARGKGNVLWVGTSNGALLRMVNGSFETILPPGTKGLEEGVQILREDHDGVLWITTQYSHLGRLDDGKLTMLSDWEKVAGACQVRLDAEGKPVLYSIKGVWQIEEGKMKLAMIWPRSGLQFLAVGQGGWWINDGEHVALWRDGKPVSQLASPQWGVRGLTLGIGDRKGNLWLSTSGHGVLRYAADGSVREFHAEGGLGGNFVRCLFEDRDGSIWVGLDGGGLSRITPGLFTLVDLREGLTSDQITAVHSDEKGVVWIGTRGDGVCAVADGKTTRVAATNVEWSTLDVTSLASGLERQVWVGTRNGRLYALNDRFETRNVALPLGGAINALFYDRKGRLWVGQRTRNQLTVMEGGKARVIHLVNGTSEIDVRVIREDAKGVIWIGTAGQGLWCQSGETFRQFTAKDGLGGESVRALCEDTDGSLWIGMENGGIAWHQEGRFVFCGPDQGMPREPVAGLLDDGKGALWWSTSGGIYRLEKQSLRRAFSDVSHRVKPVRFDRADGLVELEGQSGQSSACHTNDGRLWFATNHGVATARPALYQPSNWMAPAVIDEVVVDGQPIKEGATLAPDARRFEFRLISLDLAHSGGRFLHKLDGVDDDWVSGVSPISYTHLPTGEYRFRVKAVNRDHVESEKETVFHFAVLPPFWKRPWFVATAVLAGMTLVVGGILMFARVRVRRKLAAFRTRQAVEEERSRIARDLHDQLGASLTDLALLGDSLRNDLPEGQTSQDAAELSRRARDTIRAMDETVWVLNARNDRVESLVDYVSRSVTEWCARAGLRCRLDVPEKIDDRVIDAERRHGLYLACREAVHNIVKHARASEVGFSLRLEQDTLVIEIRDNGCGFVVESVSSGNGLLNLRERLAALNGSVMISSNPGEGTSVRFLLPLCYE